MKHKHWLIVLLVVLVSSAAIADAQGPRPGSVRAPRALAGTAFTYQGQLKKNGALVNATCDFQFGLWDDSAGGVQLGVTQTIASIVVNGLFTASIDFTADLFNGDARWLASAVSCPTGSVSYTGLNPRQKLTPAPMAFALPGLYTRQNATSPNIIGGYSGNVITPTLWGATISGGGASGLPNRAWANLATVGGGANNTASGTNATVGGGEGNAASGTWATVAGGEINIASNSQATVSGGYNNYASGSGATVGGGYSNYASGYAATVPGGFLNSATMSYTFAAGKRAKANHEGAFVWGASDDTDFASTAPNHFLVRANRVGINTNAPATTLEVAGLGDGYHTMVLRGTNTSNRRTALQLFSTSGGTPTAEFEIGTDEVSNNSHNFYIYDVTNGMTRLFVDNSGNVGIGTSSPSDTLAVFGDARVGTSGTNGCVKRFDGTAIAGSCSSDVRLKKNIAPFAAMLEPVSQLQPVYYSWRAEEFPQYGFGANTPSYGLIAQEVERVLPELVGRDEYGFKTVNYSELPLVLLQALKELHAEKDAQITALQARVAKLEQNVSAHNVVNVTYDVNAWVIVALGISALALHRGKRGR